MLSRWREHATSLLSDPWGALAVARVGLALAGLLCASEAHRFLMRATDPTLAVPTPWLEGPVPAPAVWALTAVTVLAGLAALVGWRWRASALVLAMGTAAPMLVEQQTYSNHRTYLTLVVLLLAFTAADRRWSPSRSARPTPGAQWAVLLVLSQLSVLYLFAALSKVQPTFLSGAGLRSWSRWELPEEIAMVLALGTVVGELVLAIGLWFRRSRVLACLIGFMLHVPIVLVLEEGTWELLAFALSCLALYPLHFHRERLLAETTAPA